MGGTEQTYVQEAFSSNWLSTVGPHVGEFEAGLEARLQAPVVALASGTAGIHLGLKALGVGPGDTVFCQDLTFVASANPIRYLGAEPVLIDSDHATWNMDGGLLRVALREAAARNRLPKAVVVVHLFGQCADMDAICGECDRCGVPVLEDAAEALGALYRGRAAGTLGKVGVFSFNGNKIITTTGGGALCARDSVITDKVRFWANQARRPAIEYDHPDLGYNYRMSNILAGIGRGQLEVLDLRVAQRRTVAERYKNAFAYLEGLDPMPEAAYGLHTHWLSCFLVDENRFGCSRDELIGHLEMRGIESRPVWKPMHLQPMFRNCTAYRGEVAEELYRRGICLPSSSNLSGEDQDRVIAAVESAFSRRRRPVMPGGRP